MTDTNRLARAREFFEQCGYLYTSDASVDDLVGFAESEVKAAVEAEREKFRQALKLIVTLPDSGQRLFEFYILEFKSEMTENAINRLAQEFASPEEEG
jgi:hypothetical protein